MVKIQGTLLQHSLLFLFLLFLLHFHQGFLHLHRSIPLDLHDRYYFVMRSSHQQSRVS
jgi:hypothetical protein